MNKDPRYFVLYGIFVWNVGMFTWNIIQQMPITLLAIMCVLPTILFFGIFFALDNQKESQNNLKVSRE